MLTLIVARDRNGAIGKDNTIPWDAPEDMRFFMRETTGGAIVMGRNTWESLPVKPLKNRLNIVVSSQGVAHDCVVSTIEAALAEAARDARARVYGVGGAGIYAALMPLADRLLVTEVDTVVPEADTFFPDIDPSIWREVARLPLRDAAPACEAVEYLRR